MRGFAASHKASGRGARAGVEARPYEFRKVDGKAESTYFAFNDPSNLF
jgi:hypothetical protein